MSDAPPRPPHFTLLRELALADVFTLANASCGTITIFLCLSYLDAGAFLSRPFIWFAFILLPIALVCDFMDGRVARKRRASRFGPDLDSLSDVISFGVAPATLGFTLGMRGGWDCMILTFFVVCGVARLARYNVTAEDLSDQSGKVKYFEGTPIPSSLLLVVVLGVAFATGNTGVHQLWLGGHRIGPWVLHPLSLLFALNGATMISATLRIPKP